MKNIGVMICNKYSYKCSGVGCFDAFNKKEKAFERYKDMNITLKAFFHCNGCDKDFLVEQAHKIEQMKDRQVSTIHFSRCMANHCDYYKQLKNDLKNSGFEVVDGTH